jgi:hypothetical protein
MLGPEDAFRLIVAIDLSLVFEGWGSFPGARGVRNQTRPGTPSASPPNPDLTDGFTALVRLTRPARPARPARACSASPHDQVHL